MCAGHVSENAKIINNNNKANILRGGLQSPNGGFQEGPQKIKAKIQLKV